MRHCFVIAKLRAALCGFPHRHGRPVALARALRDPRQACMPKDGHKVRPRFRAVKLCWWGSYPAVAALGHGTF